MVFPAPFLLESVKVAHFSSFSRFCSAFSAPRTVPSSSAASSSSSLSVGASYDACLDRSATYPNDHAKTYPPPVMIFPCLCSSAKYSSIVIVGKRQLSLKTSPCNRSLSEAVLVLGNIVNGLNTFPPPEINCLGWTLLGLLSRSNLHVVSSWPLFDSRASISGTSSSEAGAEARISSSILMDAIEANAPVCRRRSSSSVVFLGIMESSELTDVEEEGSDVFARLLLLVGPGKSDIRRCIG